MPEGDTLFRAAALLQPLVGRRIREARLPRGHGLVQSLTGQTVEEVRAVGKNLLIFCAGDVVIHTHLKMTGLWHLYRAGERWRRPAGDAVVVVDVGDVVGVCFRAPVARLLERRRAEREVVWPHARVDLLAEDDVFELDEAVRRLRLEPGRAVAEAILDQRCIAGVGNVYKSEGLFRRRLHPWTPVGAIDDATLRALVLDLRGLLRDNAARAVAALPERRHTVRTTTTLPEAADDAHVPVVVRAELPLAVYGRAGEPCLVCGAAILRQVQGETRRSTWWCPTCQPTTALAATGHVATEVPDDDRA